MEKRLKAYDVLQMKAKLSKKIIEPPYVRYVEMFLKGIKGLNHGSYSNVEVAYQKSGEKIAVSPGGAWCLSELQTLTISESYLIGAQMNPLVLQAAVDIPDDLVFEEHILPSTYGFLVFEDPWEVIDRWGKRLLTRAVTWQPMSDQKGRMGVQVAQYTAVSDNDDITQQLKREDAEVARNALRDLGDLQLQHVMPIQFHSSVAHGVDPSWDPLTKNAAVGPVKAMIALWMLMQQQVTETAVPSMTAKSIKRWERKRVKPQVNVINLRRRRIVSENAAQHESGGTREWSGRWMVKGHWRNQPYGPRRQDRHWVYIHPYLKGPDDKPIIDKRPRVYKLSR